MCTISLTGRTRRGDDTHLVSARGGKVGEYLALTPPLNPSGSAEGGANGRFECCFGELLRLLGYCVLKQSREDGSITIVISLIVYC